MGNLTFKPASGGDLILQNDDAGAKIQINNDDTIDITGSIDTGTYNGTIGSNATFPTGTITNYVSQTTTTTSAQSLDTSYATITGAKISNYTPTTGASKVFYSVNVRYAHVDDSRGIGSFQLFIDDVGQGAETGFSVDAITSTSYGQYVLYHTLISASGWTSGKNVELKARDYSSSYDIQLHYNPNMHQTDGGTDSVRYNQVHAIIYSIM